MSRTLTWPWFNLCYQYQTVTPQINVGSTHCITLTLLVAIFISNGFHLQDFVISTLFWSLGIAKISIPMQSHTIGENACMAYTCQAIPGVHACVLTPGSAFGVTSYSLSVYCSPNYLIYKPICMQTNCIAKLLSLMVISHMNTCMQGAWLCR